MLDGQDSSGSNVSVPFVAIMPVGPAPEELVRCEDSLRSLYHYEPHARMILIDDTEHGRQLSDRLQGIAGGSGSLYVLVNPRQSKGHGWSDGLSAGVIEGIRLGHSLQPRFAVRLDTDSLVIAPFADKIVARLEGNPRTGLLGTFLRYPDGGPRIKRDAESSIKRLMPIVRPFRFAGKWQPGLNFAGLAGLRRTIVTKAFRNGYSMGTFCQGGGYAISADLIQWVTDNVKPLTFIGTGLGEDIVLTLASYAAGLRPEDHNQPGEPFGVSMLELPFDPIGMVDRNYSIIHSVKSHGRFVESETRAFFLERRIAEAREPCL